MNPNLIGVLTHFIKRLIVNFKPCIFAILKAESNTL